MAAAQGCVLQADAQALPFLADTFDFAAAIHSLEHIRDPHLALSEVARVLRPGGWFYVGVPNRSRIIGSLGSGESTRCKIRYNLEDWKARFWGRFENAPTGWVQAGFGRKELIQLLRPQFENIQVVTEDYLRFKYTGRVPQPLLNVLLHPRILDFSCSSHYMLCQKQRGIS